MLLRRNEVQRAKKVKEIWRLSFGLCRVWSASRSSRSSSRSLQREAMMQLLSIFTSTLKKALCSLTIFARLPHTAARLRRRFVRRHRTASAWLDLQTNKSSSGIKTCEKEEEGGRNQHATMRIAKIYHRAGYRNRYRKANRKWFIHIHWKGKLVLNEGSNCRSTGASFWSIPAIPAQRQRERAWSSTTWQWPSSVRALYWLPS